MNERSSPVDGRVAFFVDLTPLVSAASEAGGRLNYARLLELAAGRGVIHKATAYLPHDPHRPVAPGDLAAIREAGFRVVAKPVRQLSDGSIRGYLGVQMAVDMLACADRCDLLLLISGDPDLVPSIQAAQALGARVEVVVCPGVGAEELAEAADSAVTLPVVLQRLVERGERGRVPGRRQPGEARIERPRAEWPTPPPPPPPPRSVTAVRSGNSSQQRSPSLRTLQGEKLSGRIAGGGSEAGKAAGPAGGP